MTTLDRFHTAAAEAEGQVLKGAFLVDNHFQIYGHVPEVVCERYSCHAHIAWDQYTHLCDGLYGWEGIVAQEDHDEHQILSAFELHHNGHLAASQEDEDPFVVLVGVLADYCRDATLYDEVCDHSNYGGQALLLGCCSLFVRPLRFSRGDHNS